MTDSNPVLQFGRKMERDLDELLQDLNIREDEGQKIVLEEDLEDLKAEARWTALAKVNSTKTFSHAAFLAHMKYAWSLAKDVSFKAIEENLFVFQFACLGDWRKVMDEGPWFFRGNAVLLEEYDGITKPSSVKFKYFAMWVRIYDLPTGFRTKNIGRQLGNKIGKTVKVDLDENSYGWRNYLRIKVNLDIEKPLTRVLYVSMGDDGKCEAFRVRYEKLAKFCAVCGLLGHTDSECGDGIHEKKDFQYGEWLIASPERKGMVKGSRSSDSTDTNGSNSKEPVKGNFPNNCSEPRSGNNIQRESYGNEDDLQDVVRSHSSGNKELKVYGKGAQKCLTLQDASGQHAKTAMDLIPITGNVGTDQHELQKDGGLECRGTKRLRKADEIGGLPRGVPPGTMKTLSWNCCGIGNPATVKELRDLAKDYAPSVLFIMETQIDKYRVENLRYTLGFDNSFAVNSDGRSGGLGLFWQNDVVVSIKKYSNYHIDTIVSDQ
ncbi:hypothetical protein EJB05_00900, partial [Eragrostis curvula]